MRNNSGTNTISGTPTAAPHVSGQLLSISMPIRALIRLWILGVCRPLRPLSWWQRYLKAMNADYNEHAAQGSNEPLLFVNSVAFGSDGSCDAGVPTPGTAGEDNTWSVTAATPGETVHFVGVGSVGPTIVPGCHGQTVDIGSPVVLGSSIVDASGNPSLTNGVPSSASGVTGRFQSVELCSCRVSNLVTHFFP